MITVYATRWCPDCGRAKEVLDTHRVAYKLVYLEEEPSARDIVLRLNGGMRSVPTIIFDDGSILVEPSNSQLAARLEQAQAISKGAEPPE